MTGRAPRTARDGRSDTIEMDVDVKIRGTAHTRDTKDKVIGRSIFEKDWDFRQPRRTVSTTALGLKREVSCIESTINI